MNAMNFEAVFVTGLVRNNTTRFTLDQKILARYKTCCQRLIDQNEHVPAHQLYDQAAMCLQRLMNNPDAKVPIMKVEAVRV